VSASDSIIWVNILSDLILIRICLNCFDSYVIILRD
jgi:hypothetical protein